MADQCEHPKRHERIIELRGELVRWCWKCGLVRGPAPEGAAVTYPSKRGTK